MKKRNKKTDPRQRPSTSPTPHNTTHIPHPHAFIPPRARSPSLASKQAPINARAKLRMAIHHAQHPPVTGDSGRTHAWRCQRRRRPCSIAPHPHRHIVARAREDVAPVRTPRETPHSVLVAGEFEDGPCGVSEVPGADYLVDASGGEDVGAVLVPVVGQHLCGGGGGDGDEGCGLRRGRTEVEEAEGAVGGDGGEEVGGVGREEGRVGAGGCGEGLERALRLRGPLWIGGCVSTGDVSAGGMCQRGDVSARRGGWGRGGRADNLDGPVPGGGTEGGLVDEVPVHRKHLARVLLPRGDGQLGEGGVKQLDGAVARGHRELVLVQLREGDVVEGVLRVEPGGGQHVPPSTCPLAIHTTSQRRSRRPSATGCTVCHCRPARSSQRRRRLCASRRRASI